MTELGQRLGVQILLALPALFFLFRGWQAKLPSRRLATFALACGLAMLVMPERMLGWSAVDYPVLCIGIGLARVVLGIAGLALAGVAFSRRADDGAGPFRLLIAAVLGVVHLGVGVSALMVADGALPGSPQVHAPQVYAPQVYSSSDGAFRITLSSDRWREIPAPKSVVAFSHDQPEMFLKVRTVTRDQEQSDFDALAQLNVERIESVPRIRGKLKMEDGTTPGGNHYRYFSGLDATPGGEAVYAAYSVVWSPQTKVLVETSFEGTPKVQSSAGSEADLQTIERAARQICLSVE
jgi:hypothetical protein